MLLVLLFVYLICIGLWYYLSRRNLIKLGSKIPGPTSYPIIGNALLFWGRPESVFKEVAIICRFYSRMVAFWLGPKLNVILFDPKDVEAILRLSKNTEKSDLYDFLKPWLGDSILFSKGQKFRRNKALIMQAFNMNNFKRYLVIINKNARNLALKLAEEVEKDVNIIPFISSCTAKTFLETSLGVDLKSVDNNINVYTKAIERLGRLAHIRMYKFWLHPNIIFRFSKLKKEQDKYIDIIHRLIDKIIQNRKDEIDKKKSLEHKSGVCEFESQKNLLDCLLDAQNNENDKNSEITDRDIKDEINTMMFAGQDTTTVSIGFVLSLLGIHKDCQDKVIKELDEIFGESDRPVSYDDVINLHYLEQVIQETWRLYPPIPLIGRKTSRDICLENITLPKGCTVGVVIMMLHRNPLYYKHPHKFNPDNFLPEMIKQRHPCSYIPFSTGYRSCVGPKYAMIVIKVILATLLRKYQVHSNIKEKEFKLAADITLKRRGGFTLCLQHRK